MGDFEIRDGILVKYHGSGGDVVIPEGITNIGDGVFAGCTGLTAVTIPDRVTEIGQFAFAGCTGLTAVTLPKRLKLIRYHTFSGCTSMTTVTIPDSLELIGDGAFENCTALASAVIPDGMKMIGWEAFRNCAGLTSVQLPGSITNIGRHAFADCPALASVTIRSICLDQEALTSLLKHTTLTRILKTLTKNGEPPQTTSYWDRKRFNLHHLLDAAPILWTAFRCCPVDERNTGYIREHFTDLFPMLFKDGNTDTLHFALQSGRFDDLLPNYIDHWIEYAISHEMLNIQLLLTNYKAEKIGYADPTDHLKI